MEKFFEKPQNRKKPIKLEIIQIYGMKIKRRQAKQNFQI